jgi:NAD(P)-dependent dehydrogenase (short-subunit alcohol dehydrogenase family)
MVDLAGKNALVTGAALGIGNAYARALAAEGVNVAVCDRLEEIMDLPAELEAMGVKSVACIADVGKPDDVRRYVDEAIAALGSIDILINNAGEIWPTLVDDDIDKSIADYEGIVGTNLKGEYLVGRAVITQMLKQGTGGEIVNIDTDHMVTCGSPVELCPHLETCPWGDTPRITGGGDVMDLYDASKWGLNGLMFAWAKALKPNGIRVNAMCMGATDSHMIRGFFNYAHDEEDHNPEAKADIDTWMTKEDSAQVVIDLLKEGPGGRTANTMNLCIGRPTILEPALPHIYITEEEINGTA